MPTDSSAQPPHGDQSPRGRTVSESASEPSPVGTAGATRTGGDAAADSDAPPSHHAAAGPAWSWRRFARNATLAATVLFLVGYTLVEGVIPHVIPKNFGVVEEGRVYRSGELTTTALESVVKEHGIRTVIDFGAHDKDPAGERREQQTADLLGVKRVVLNLEGDATGDPNRYVEALRLMNDPEAQPVLVHCAAGAQRTGCAVALYRSLVEGWDDERALSEALDYRHDPADNPRMPAMYKTWKDEIERAYESGGSIDYAPPALPEAGG